MGASPAVGEAARPRYGITDDDCGGRLRGASHGGAAHLLGPAAAIKAEGSEQCDVAVKHELIELQAPAAPRELKCEARHENERGRGGGEGQPACRARRKRASDLQSYTADGRKRGRISDAATPVECATLSKGPWKVPAARPSPEECWYAARELAALHGEVSLKTLRSGTLLEQSVGQPEDQKTVLDSLVRTMLSQNTTDILSQRAYSSLKAAFPSWEQVRTAKPGLVQDAIRCGGRAATLVERFQTILNTLKEERGECTLEYVRDMSDDEVKQELCRFKGVGSKTISCVMMFCLRRPEFPVDTHIWRISKLVGWVPKTATREEAYTHLNATVPNEIKFDLHVLLVEHGKHCTHCAKNGKPRKAPLQHPCPLRCLAADPKCFAI